MNLNPQNNHLQITLLNNFHDTHLPHLGLIMQWCWYNTVISTSGLLLP